MSFASWSQYVFEWLLLFYFFFLVFQEFPISHWSFHFPSLYILNSLNLLSSGFLFTFSSAEYNVLLDMLNILMLSFTFQ